MKSVLIFLAFAFAVKGEMTLQEFIADISSKMFEAGVSCAEKLDISDAAMVELSQKKIPTEHDGKCVVHCVNSHFGFMNDNGNFDTEKILDFMEPLKTIDAEMYQNVLKVEKVCGDIKEDDPCETAGKGIKCVKEEMKKLGVTEELYEF